MTDACFKELAKVRYLLLCASIRSLFASVTRRNTQESITSSWVEQPVKGSNISLWSTGCVNLFISLIWFHRILIYRVWGPVMPSVWADVPWYLIGRALTTDESVEITVILPDSSYNCQWLQIYFKKHWFFPPSKKWMYRHVCGVAYNYVVCR